MTAANTDDDLGLDIERATPSAVPQSTTLAERPALVEDSPPEVSTELVPVASPPRTAPPAVAGAGLITEAELAVDERRWRDALRVLEAIDSIGASSVHTDALVAISATHLSKSRMANEAIGRIRASTPTIETHRSLAAISLARHEFLTADSELREVIRLADQQDEKDETATDWAHFAAVYAGLGWFDQATECLDRSETLGATANHQWMIGRSINHWGMSKTWALAIAALLFYPLGILAVAVGMTVPFMVRELRLTQVDERMATLASDAWADERWLRVAHASGVLLTVVLWSLAIQL